MGRRFLSELLRLHSPSSLPLGDGDRDGDRSTLLIGRRRSDPRSRWGLQDGRLRRRLSRGLSERDLLLLRLGGGLILLEKLLLNDLYPLFDQSSHCGGWAGTSLSESSPL